MIYFTIPASSSLVDTDLDIFIDRNPQASSTLNLHTYEVATGLSQTAANGINIRSEQLSVSIASITTERALLIDAYLNFLGTQDLVIVFPEGSKKYSVLIWNIAEINILYCNISISLELMYL
jgi:phage-related protein